MKQGFLIGLYLIAIIVANLLVIQFGTLIVIPVAFFLVGLDITTRDYLHEIWASNRWLKMGILIAVGSLLSWLLNRNSGQIALASFIAFVSSAVIDTLTYSWLFKRRYLVKVNGSNLFSSFTDSVVFLTIAFGSFMPLLILAQFAAKFGGGLMWSLVLPKFKRKVEVIA